MGKGAEPSLLSFLLQAAIVLGAWLQRCLFMVPNYQSGRGKIPSVVSFRHLLRSNRSGQEARSCG